MAERMLLETVMATQLYEKIVRALSLFQRNTKFSAVRLCGNPHRRPLDLISVTCHNHGMTIEVDVSLYTSSRL